MDRETIDQRTEDRGQKTKTRTVDRTGAGVLECWDLRFCFSPKGAGRGGQGSHFWRKRMGNSRLCVSMSIARWLAGGGELLDTNFTDLHELTAGNFFFGTGTADAVRALGR
jgi:hypothetical protein